MLAIPLLFFFFLTNTRTACCVFRFNNIIDFPVSHVSNLYSIAFSQQSENCLQLKNNFFKLNADKTEL